MKRCLLKCYQCSGKLLSSYKYDVGSALNGQADKHEVLRGLSETINEIQAVAVKAKRISSVCYENLNEWLEKYIALREQLERSLIAEPSDTT